VNREQLLADINRDLPANVDWKLGAKDYVEAAVKSSGRDSITKYALTKPMYELSDDSQGLAEAIYYLNNFTNIIDLLKLPSGSRVMDVACGAGWLSHYLMRFGYKTYGFDISADFIGLAKLRISKDPYIEVSEIQLNSIFEVHDIESDPLPKALHGTFDAIVLESCLHHFHNPIAALTNLASCLSEKGVIIIIEGERRLGGIRQSYQDVMTEFNTIERPYFRNHLTSILRESGLPHYEFVGQLNGFFSPRDPHQGHASYYLKTSEFFKNTVVCSAHRGNMERIFPFLKFSITGSLLRSAKTFISSLFFGVQRLKGALKAKRQS
jgi:SAM-dependent methyltransferase